MLRINGMCVSEWYKVNSPIWIGGTFERFDYSIIVCLYVSTMDRCVQKENNILTILIHIVWWWWWQNRKPSIHTMALRVCEMWTANTMLAFPLLLLLHHKSTVKLTLSYFVVFFSISSDIFSDYVHHVPAATTPRLFAIPPHLITSLWDFIPFQPIYDAFDWRD